jgi:hypothetical protein
LKIIPGRRRSIGLAGAAIWLIVISFICGVWSLLVIETPIARLALICTFVLVGALFVVSIIVIRAALGLPVSNAPRTPEEQQMVRRFAWVFGAETLAFVIVNSIVIATGNIEMIVSLDLIIVGIHFFPLARIFHVPRYNLMGLLFCVIPLVTLLAIPKQLEVGYALAWYVVPSLGCGLVALMTAAIGLLEAWQSISKNRDVA